MQKENTVLKFPQCLGNSQTSAEAEMKEERERISGKTPSHRDFLLSKERLAQNAARKGGDAALLMVLGGEQPWGSYQGCWVSWKTLGMACPSYQREDSTKKRKINVLDYSCYFTNKADL